MNPIDILVVHYKERTEASKSCLNTILETLEKSKVSFRLIRRELLTREMVRGKELLITVGGDGTLLSASHFIKNKTLAFAVNSDPKTKVGFLTSTNQKKFKSDFKRYLKKEFKILPLARLEAKVGKKKFLPALNEVLVANEKSYKTARYVIKIGKDSEFQRSSGVIIATPAGSYAWASAAGGKKLPLTSNKFQFVVREPYPGKNKKFKLQKKILKKGEVVQVIPDNKKAVVVIDSHREYPVAINQKVNIRVSKTPLKVIIFR